MHLDLLTPVDLVSCDDSVVVYSLFAAVPTVCWSFCGEVHCVLSSLAIVFLGKREQIDLLCVVPVCDLCLFLMMALLVCSLPVYTYFLMFSLVLYLHL